MATLQPLFSGSSGNAVLLESKTNALLVDAGVSGRKIISALSENRKTISNIGAILVTHEHMDHIQSVGSLSRKFHIPVYANEKTWKAMHPVIGDIPPSLCREIGYGDKFSVGDIDVCSFPIPHDAAAPCGYNFWISGRKITVATDIGQMNEKVFLSLSGSEEILLESNYDIVMLQKGPYPFPLKQRILGPLGHLSNKEAAITCARLASLGTKKIILGHLSKENNTPHLAYDIVKHYIEECGFAVERDVSLSVAPRSSV